MTTHQSKTAAEMVNEFCDDQEIVGFLRQDGAVMWIHQHNVAGVAPVVTSRLCAMIETAEERKARPVNWFQGWE